jgi:hypothetical protein
MVKAMLLGSVEMAEVEARVVNMGKELCQLLEDYPSLQPSGWTYVTAIMSLHQQVYDEAVELKKATLGLVDKKGSGMNDPLASLKGKVALNV